MATLERLVPAEIDTVGAIGAETLRLHLERYRWAAARVWRGARVLDMACGVGYGSAILAEAAGADGRIAGVDIAPPAVDYACEHYSAPNTEFHCADAMSFGQHQAYDVVVSLETIEHVREPHRLVARLASLVMPGGLLIASVPITPSVDANPHHLTDFTLKSFRRVLIDAGTSEIDLLLQRQVFNPLKVLSRSDARLVDSRPNLLGYYARNPGKAFLRLFATVRYGFENRYATIAARIASSSDVTSPSS